MYIFLVIVGFGAAYASGDWYYHTAVGIPLAAKIKAQEVPILTKRIVGGEVAVPKAHPYLAGLIGFFPATDNVTVCGSSILTASRLITAAHCWYDGEKQVSSFEVVLGAVFLFYGGTRVKTSSVVMHPQWSPRLNRNDIAIVYMSTPISFKDSVQPVALPNGSERLVGQWAIAAGYGFTSDTQDSVSGNTVLKEVRLQVVPTSFCEDIYGDVVQFSNICTAGTGGVGICHGDSGGPLVIVTNGRPTLVGVSQFVNKEGCQVGNPSVFARVISFMNFIRRNL